MAAAARLAGPAAAGEGGGGRGESGGLSPRQLVGRRSRRARDGDAASAVSEAGGADGRDHVRSRDGSTGTGAGRGDCGVCGRGEAHCGGGAAAAWQALHDVRSARGAGVICGARRPTSGGLRRSRRGRLSADACAGRSVAAATGSRAGVCGAVAATHRTAFNLPEASRPSSPTAARQWRRAILRPGPDFA